MAAEGEGAEAEAAVTGASSDEEVADATADFLAFVDSDDSDSGMSLPKPPGR